MEKMLKKLEEMDPQERDQMKKMLNERKDGKHGKGENSPLTWMYKQDKPDTEDYLLGRKVDKHLNPETTKEDNGNDSPGAIFQEDHLVKRAEMDMLVKMREDPLFQIRKREEDAKKKLLQNPIKMKQLQKMVEEQQTRKKKKMKKEKKKHKKHKKRKADSSDSSDSDSDDDLINRYLAIVTQKKKDAESGKSRDKSSKDSDRARQRHRDSDEEIRDSRYDKQHMDRRKRQHSESESHGERKYGLTSDHPKSHRPRSRSPGRKRSRSPAKRSRSPVRKRSRSPAKRSRSPVRKRSRSPVRKRSRSPVRKKSRSPVRKRSRSPVRKRSRSPVRKKSRSPVRKRSRSPARKKSRSPKASKHRKRSRSPESAAKRKQKELEKKRLEMMENARWRDEQREQNVERYKAEAEKEREMLEKQKDQGGSADFVKPMMMQHADQSSVADRIRRNKYNIQRTNADMEKSFKK